MERSQSLFGGNVVADVMLWALTVARLVRYPANSYRSIEINRKWKLAE